ncbi:unnamed protein product [Bursaphelenchus xylophilus]|uniref:(pine wood nematode) hypothetical protein n=1 Tax=Bursaphelenchus xylophilus TaxID=6326 RepID=A0A1I7SRS1_BURXY|nr:unnamed protein product [Bursaphelenchus xylophilus]CAG9101911.1 unnamed protein product [Bursaphelenchus xylophilus]
MVLLKLFFLLFLTQQCHGYVNNFKMSIFFNDQPTKVRYLLIDLATSESFALHSKEFAEIYGDENTFDSAASDTFKSLNETLKLSYAEELNTNSSAVTGVLGEDDVTVVMSFVEGEFLVAKEMSGNDIPIGRFDGSAAAGRIGFSKKKDTKTNLRDGLLDDGPLKVLCLDTSVAKDGSKKYTTIASGGYVYHDNFRTKVSSLPSSDGLWKFNVNKISIGKSTFSTVYPATLSTTYNGLTLPEPIFQRLIRLLNAQFDRERGRYLVFCNLNRDILISVNSNVIPIQYDAYTETIYKSNWCGLKVRSTKERKIVLGAPFYTNNGICLDFQNETIHFYDASPRERINNYVITGNFRKNGITKTVFEERI